MQDDANKNIDISFSSCSQYNGFTADGDYNRDIPEQRLIPDEEPDIKPVHFAVREDLPSLTSSPVDKGEEGNGLCRTCNLNQVTSMSLAYIFCLTPFLIPQQLDNLCFMLP